MSGKGPALYDYIEIDGHDVGNFFSEIGFDFNDEQLDGSGFSASGTDELIAGKRVQAVNGTLFDTKDAGGSWDVLYRIYRDRLTVAFKHRDNQNLPVSATNPSLEGNIKILSWGGGGTRGQMRTFPVVLTADDAGLEYTTT